MITPIDIFRKINSFIVKNDKILLKHKQVGVVPPDDLEEVFKNLTTAEWDDKQAFALTDNNWLICFYANMPGSYRLERKWPWNRRLLNDMVEASMLFYSQINVLVVLMYAYYKCPELRELVETGSINKVWDELERIEK